MSLRDVTLVAASVPATATLAEAVAALSEARAPALAVLDDESRVVGIFTEADALRAVFPGYLAEVRHTAFLTDDASSLDELARAARDRPVLELARAAEALAVDDSQIHAAERLLHTEEDALPVVDGQRFVGMISKSTLCRSRLARVERDPGAQS